MEGEPTLSVLCCWISVSTPKTRQSRDRKYVVRSRRTLGKCKGVDDGGVKSDFEFEWERGIAQVKSPTFLGLMMTGIKERRRKDM